MILILFLSSTSTMRFINWDRWGELSLAAISFLDFVVLLVMSQTPNIFVMYVGYLIYRVLYQLMITIAQFGRTFFILFSNL